jgi:hypothetical protein
MPNERDDEIRQRAHRIWVEEGRGEGREADHWARPTREIEGNGTMDPVPKHRTALASPAN